MNWPGGQALNANAAQAVQLTGVAAGDPPAKPLRGEGLALHLVAQRSRGEVDEDENAGVGERLLIQAR